ncbi:XrtA system polysaccharide deacetylase [Geobacter sp. SVR]|uniref:XrtA system polysaccharide deacetylase n=1 Tax=Geobacter sp. SVR TaxID=2495594 RepID=UPI00143F013E|nr:XrtA system polysaccharide deacetylase [Geobacter sp. SVR]GCF85164.1 polysaccharide deacetylase [Geobacter sp. SVR]
MLNALSVDVEDYFQVNAFAGRIRYEEWDLFPLRVENNTRRILDMFDECAQKATFFILGWIAERCPLLVREIHRRGHEIACHGYRHQLVYRLTAEQFRADIAAAKGILEDICGERVLGYRAPSYSITNQSLWALDVLAEEGFSYDSSIFPIRHDVYGIPGGERFPYDIAAGSGTLREFPLSTYPLGIGGWRTQLPVAGGGYLRLFPVSLVSRAIGAINSRERQPVIVYFHPWEIDPQQPRIRAGWRSSFRHYLNLGRMEFKIRHLLKRFRFAPAREVLQVSSEGRTTLKTGC